MSVYFQMESPESSSAGDEDEGIKVSKKDAAVKVGGRNTCSLLVSRFVVCGDTLLSTPPF